MGSRITRAAVVLIFGGMCPGVALAQVPPLRAAPPPTQKPLTVTLGVTSEYDTNVARASAEGARQRGLVREDLRLDPEVRVQLVAPAGRQTFTLDGTLGYSFYNRNSVLDRERINLRGGTGINLARCQANASTTYDRRQADLRDLTIIDGAGGLIGGRDAQNTGETLSVEGVALCGGEVGIRPLLFARYDQFDNSEATRQISDSRTFSYGGGISYAQPSIGEIRLFAGHREIDYPNRIPLVNALTSEIRVFRVGAQYDRRIGTRLQGTFQIAYTEVETDLSADAKQDFVTYSGELTFNAAARLQFRAGVSREVEAARGTFADYEVINLYTLRAIMPLTPTTTLTVEGLRREREVEGAIAFFGPLLTDETLDSVNATLRLAFSPRTSFLFQGGVEQRDANLGLYTYQGGRFSIGIQYAY